MKYWTLPNVRSILLFRQVPAIFCLILGEIVSTKQINSFLSLSLEDYKCCLKKKNSNFHEQFPSFYDLAQYLIIVSGFVSVLIALKSPFFFSWATQLLLLIKAMQSRTGAKLISNKEYILLLFSTNKLVIVPAKLAPFWYSR